MKYLIFYSLIMFSAPNNINWQDELYFRWKQHNPNLFGISNGLVVETDEVSYKKEKYTSIYVISDSIVISKLVKNKKNEIIPFLLGVKSDNSLFLNSVDRNFNLNSKLEIIMPTNPISQRLNYYFSALDSGTVINNYRYNKNGLMAVDHISYNNKSLTSLSHDSILYKNDFPFLILRESSNKVDTIYRFKYSANGHLDSLIQYLDYPQMGNIVTRFYENNKVIKEEHSSAISPNIMTNHYFYFKEGYSKVRIDKTHVTRFMDSTVFIYDGARLIQKETYNEKRKLILKSKFEYITY